MGSATVKFRNSVSAGIGEMGWLGVKSVPAGLSNLMAVTVENDNSCWANTYSLAA